MFKCYLLCLSEMFVCVCAASACELRRARFVSCLLGICLSFGEDCIYLFVCLLIYFSGVIKLDSAKIKSAC